jgi:hypothetical protein
MSDNKTLNLPVRNKVKNTSNSQLFNHQARLNVEQTKKFTRVREILGGYTSAELVEKLIEKAIEEYYDGAEIENKELLPKDLRD